MPNLRFVEHHLTVELPYGVSIGQRCQEISRHSWLDSCRVEMDQPPRRFMITGAQPLLTCPDALVSWRRGTVAPSPTGSSFAVGALSRVADNDADREQSGALWVRGLVVINLQDGVTPIVTTHKCAIAVHLNGTGSVDAYSGPIVDPTVAEAFRNFMGRDALRVLAGAESGLVDWGGGNISMQDFFETPAAPATQVG